MVQSLAGDRVDGYAGCPGIGMERSKRILSDPKELVPEHGVVTRGARKGQATTKWVSKPTDSMWRCIVTHYEKAGRDEAEALLNARLARILRAGEYDRETGAVKLWVPN
jgi:DNA polymerase-1